MIKYYIIFLFLFRNGVADIYAQEVPIKHTIVKGETIEIIAKKYALNPSDLYQLNPSLINGFYENDVIIISKTKVINIQKDFLPPVIIHIVQANETKFGLSKKYNITIQELEQQNPHIIAMLQKGHELKIQGRAIQSNSNNLKSLNSGNYTTHVVQPKETLYGISKKYKVIVSQLVDVNRAVLGTFLQIGQILKIPSNSQPQESNIDNLGFQFHLVEIGETKYGLSKKFAVTINELENLNPQIVSMLKIGQRIKIPTTNIATSQINKDETQVSVKTALDEELENPVFQFHIVESRETKYGLSKKFAITVEELENLNPQIVEMLKVGQRIKIPANGSAKTVFTSKNAKSEVPVKIVVVDKEIVNPDIQFHIVETGETKHGLSKKFGVTIEELEKQNPQIIEMLQVGQKIIIPVKNLNNSIAAKEINKNQLTVITEKLLPKKEIVAISDTTVLKGVLYEVKPQETLYGLSKMTGLSPEKLIELNPQLSDGVKTGMILNIPSEKIAGLTIIKTNPKAITPTTLLQSIKKEEKKEIAFLMPFAEKEYLDFIKSPKKNSKQISGSLEYYSGAAMAIDSIKAYNVLISSSIFKINQLNITDDDFSNLIKNNIQNYKTVFYPTQEHYSEKLGNYLSKNNIPLIISDADESTSTAASTYVSVPLTTHLKKLVLDYLISKNENLIVINDPSRKENKEFIIQNYPQAKFVKISEDGILDSESLKSLLKSSKKNYVVLDTDKVALILTTTTLLLKDSKEYDMQIALLEPIKVLIDEGLSDIRFKILKMIYPSLYKPSNPKGMNKFKKDYLRKYGFEASQEAIKGFDITFDALVRLFQDKDFEFIAKESTTEQLNFKFRYIKKLDEGYFNWGSYLLQYDEDSNDKIIN